MEGDQRIQPHAAEERRRRGERHADHRDETLVAERTFDEFDHRPDSVDGDVRIELANRGPCRIRKRHRVAFTTNDHAHQAVWTGRVRDIELLTRWQRRAIVRDMAYYANDFQRF